MSVKAAMRGASEMYGVLRKISAKFPDRVAASIYKRGQVIMTKSKRLCPVASDGGELRASGQVHAPVRKGRNISVTLSYGGAASAYAIAVHETPSDYDPPSWRSMYAQGGEIDWTSEGTGPKFLERPINEAQATLAADIASDVNLERNDI